MREAIRSAAEFALLGRLYEYVLSKVTVSDLPVRISQGTPPDDIHVFRIHLEVPKVSYKFFYEVVMTEARQFFKHAEVSGGSMELSAMGFTHHRAKVTGPGGEVDGPYGEISIYVSDVVLGELFCVSPLAKIYEYLGRTLGDALINYCDHTKMMNFIKLYEAVKKKK